MNDTMRAVVIREPGGPEVLEVREVPVPEPAPGEIRVRVAAAGVNRADLLQRKGGHPAPPGWPRDIPGMEFSGVVEEVGAGVGRWRPGHAVMGILGGGGYAECVVTHEDAAMAVPPGMAVEVAGAIPEVFLTAFDAVALQERLQPGETLLVHAVGSGVGTAAVQLGRMVGATVLVRRARRTSCGGRASWGCTTPSPGARDGPTRSWRSPAVGVPT